MGRSNKTALLLVLIGVFIYSTAIAGMSLSPADAMQINKGWSLELRKYRQYSKNEYGASSNYFELAYGDGINNDNLSFYISGTKVSVNKLWLMLNVYAKQPRPESQLVLAGDSRSLFLRVFKQELPKDIWDTLLEGKTGSWTYEGCKIEVKNNIWPTGKGYDAKFIIQLSN